MPHQCTNCGRRFADGSKQMLSGCPDCGGNKFQFIPDGADRGEADASRGEAGATQPSSSESTPQSDRPAETSVQSELRTEQSTRPGEESSSAGEQPSTPADTSPEPSSTASDRPSESSTASSASTDQPPNQPADQASDQPSDASGSAAREFLSRLKGATGTGTGTDVTETSETTEVDSSAPEADVEDDADIIEPSDPGPIAAETSDEEDFAQHDARSATVPTDELREVRDNLAREAAEAAAEPDATEPDAEVSQSTTGTSPAAGESTPADPSVTEPATDPDDVVDAATAAADTEELETPANPDLAQLRAELNDQFESIKIVAPGQYELNLMELYDREEYVISLQEDGRYIIEVPDAWNADADDED